MKKMLFQCGLLLAFAWCAVVAPALGETGADYRSRGAKLFTDSGLGTNGKNCAACHQDGSAWAGKPRFPKVGLGGMHTLDQAIQICVVNALGGKPLAWDDERLTALAVFVDAAYAPKK